MSRVCQRRGGGLACLSALAILLLSASTVLADKVVLKIRVGNPIEKAQPKEIKINLPPGIGTNEIINMDGLDLGYDVKNDVYYVYKKLDLEPKQILTYNVEFKDIWVIPEEKLNELQKHVDGMVEKLKGKEQEKTAQDLKTEISQLLLAVKAAQEQNSIRSGIKTIQHIRAYEANLVEMETAGKFIGRMENLVLGTGQDPGRLEGDPKGSPLPKRDIEMKPQDYKTAVIKITLRNVSPSEKREIEVRRDLPPEIKANDILDPGGLEVRADLKAGVCYVFSNKVELAAGETKAFDVKIRDKWNVNFPRFPYLRTSASNILARATAKEKFKSIENMLQKLIVDINEVEKESAPAELNDKYVAFYRHQATRLDVIERKINRVEAALKPFETKVGFNAPPPNPKTTWMIIWIILGFLGFLSLVFFFRWYSKTKAEKLTDENT
ncbi:MAG: hypothetical protein PHR77_03820 [Kiritimatiellae bacterium]|nr:hypothetical protein [Kiritimatiellia bacterium]MDD5521925.1 hypothetical protein [Kiritimatiellia bacterium]